MEAKFGPDSEFSKKMEAFGKEMEAKFGPDSEFQKKIKEQHRAEIEGRPESRRQEPSPSRSRADEDAKAPTTARDRRASDRRRERRINELEAQIKKLIDELKVLKQDAAER
jgi:hypothetical protein